jgi:hypothetical protein
MAIPTGDALGLDVQVIDTSGPAPTVVRATLQRFDGSQGVLDVAASGLGVGDAIVLDFPDPSIPLARGRVEAVETDALHFRLVEAKERDPREFERVVAPLSVRYCPAPSEPDDATVRTWLEDGIAPGGAGWHRPDPLVDFSASGISFEDRATCRPGDRLFLELGVPGRDDRWRALAKVLRVDPLTPDAFVERDPDVRASHQIAVVLDAMRAQDRQALLEHTLESQRLPGEEAADA